MKQLPRYQLSFLQRGSSKELASAFTDRKVWDYWGSVQDATYLTSHAKYAPKVRTVRMVLLVRMVCMVRMERMIGMVRMVRMVHMSRVSRVVWYV